MFKTYYQGPKSDHFDGKYFFNPQNPYLHSLVDVFRWKLSSHPKPWPDVSVDQKYDIPPQRVFGDALRVSFVGHSTMLIQTQGLNILTDPVWSYRAGPLGVFGPKRHTSPGILFDNLPPVDLILVSHNHYDHMDLLTLNKLCRRDNAFIITPLGNDAIIKSNTVKINCKAIDWYENYVFSSVLNIHLLPSQHWSARGVFDRNKALWGAFVLGTPNGNIYFAGDTGYGQGDHFREAKHLFGNFRFAMLPIGAYEPRWFMKYSHLSPEDAVAAFVDLGNPYTAAIHFQTFQLGDEGFFEPQNHLASACCEEKNLSEKFRALQVGDSWRIP